MGSEISRKCPRCGVELLENNMKEHLGTCSKVDLAAKRADGTVINVKYNGPQTGATSVTNALTYDKN